MRGYRLMRLAAWWAGWRDGARGRPEESWALTGEAHPRVRLHATWVAERQAAVLEGVLRRHRRHGRNRELVVLQQAWRRRSRMARQADSAHGARTAASRAGDAASASADALLLATVLVLQLLLTAGPAARVLASRPAGLAVALVCAVALWTTARLLGQAAADSRGAARSGAHGHTLVALSGVGLLAVLATLALLREAGGLGGGPAAGREVSGDHLAPGLLPGVAGVDVTLALVLALREWVCARSGWDPMSALWWRPRAAGPVWRRFRARLAERAMDRVERRAAAMFDRWSVALAVAQQRLQRIDAAGQRCSAAFAAAYVSRCTPHEGKLLPPLFDHLPMVMFTELEPRLSPEFERLLRWLRDLDP